MQRPLVLDLHFLFPGPEDWSRGQPLPAAAQQQQQQQLREARSDSNLAALVRHHADEYLAAVNMCPPPLSLISGLEA